MTSRHTRRQAGFSLIEVLVAFVILSLAVSVLFRILSGGLRNIDRSQGYARAAMVAETVLAETGVSEPLNMASGSGESADGRFRWRRTIEPYPVWDGDLQSAVPVSAYRVEVVVSWGEVDRRHRLGLRSIRLDRGKTTGG